MCSGSSLFCFQTLSKEGSTFQSLKSSNLIRIHPFIATWQVTNSEANESEVGLRKLVLNINFNTEPGTVITSLLAVITDLLKVITDLLTVITDFLRPHSHHRIWKMVPLLSEMRRWLGCRRWNDCCWFRCLKLFGYVNSWKSTIVVFGNSNPW